jgi:hypothetical protein
MIASSHHRPRRLARSEPVPCAPIGCRVEEDAPIGDDEYIWVRSGPVSEERRKLTAQLGAGSWAECV